MLYGVFVVHGWSKLPAGSGCSGCHKWPRTLSAVRQLAVLQIVGIWGRMAALNSLSNGLRAQISRVLLLELRNRSSVSMHASRLSPLPAKPAFMQQLACSVIKFYIHATASIS